MGPVDKPAKPMTRGGFTILADEHEWLARTERPRVLAAIQVAAAEGDRSENAEYIYGRKRLRELDKRLRYLDSLLTDVQIIDIEFLRGSKVCVGSTVTVVDEDGETKVWTIVGEGEADHRNATISWKSPVAKALIGKAVGDTVLAPRPKGDVELEIIDLHFGKRHWQAS
jgi:transcription elongation factor GreB